MDFCERIVLGEVHFGRPAASGTGITAGDVPSYLAGGMSGNEIAADFLQFTRQDIRACFAFAAERERRLASAPST